LSSREFTERPAAETLRCVECDATTTDGHGWRAFLTISDEVAVSCPNCVAREFDLTRPE
jgi:hypothetical protein